MVGAMTWLIVRREVRERLQARSYAVSTVVLVLAILALGVVGRIIAADEPDAVEIGVVEPVPTDLSASLTEAGELLDRTFEVVPLAAGDVATAVEEDEVDLAVDPSAGEVVFHEQQDDQILAVLQQVLAEREVRAVLADLGVGSGEADEVLSPEPLSVSVLDADDSEGLAILTGTVVSVLLFISLQTFGTYVLTGVVEEKSSAVVELLLARVGAAQLLAGKVIGIGATALLQFVVAVAAGLVSLAVSGVDVPAEIWSTLPVAVLWFLGGYTLYSTLLALAGSLVSRQEDAQAAAAPIFTVLVGAYVLVFFFGYVPESTASTVMSMVPPLAPFLMPMRMAAGAASVVEVVVAFGLLAVSVVVAWRLAATIYEQVLLRRGSRIGWRDAMGLLRSR